MIQASSVRAFVPTAANLSETLGFSVKSVLIRAEAN